MIIIVDYGLGNLSSIKNMLRRLGHKAEISGDPATILAADKLILPGVGAYDHGMRNIAERGLRDALDRKALTERVPVLGICLGMQLLFEGSEEGTEPGLGWIPGRATLFRFPEGAERLKVPHMGWNEVAQAVKHPLWHDIPDHARFYFVHSYYIEAGKPQQVVGRGHYGKDFAAALAEGSRFAVQFHPEKSHTHGLQLLQNFVAWDGRW